jgi:hypothetical protein
VFKLETTAMDNDPNKTAGKNEALSKGIGAIFVAILAGVVAVFKGGVHTAEESALPKVEKTVATEGAESAIARALRSGEEWVNPHPLPIEPNNNAFNQILHETPGHGPSAPVDNPGTFPQAAREFSISSLAKASTSLGGRVSRLQLHVPSAVYRAVYDRWQKSQQQIDGLRPESTQDEVNKARVEQQALQEQVAILEIQYG